MNCQQVEPLLSSYLDGPGQLSPRTSEAISQHLRACRSCEEELQGLRWVVSQLKTQSSPKAPADLAARLHRRLALEPAPPRPRLAALRGIAGGLNWPSLAAGGAIAAALTVLVMHVSQPMVGIQVGSVPVDQNVGLQIAFDVGRNVKDVTFDIKLSNGLRFIDAKGQPVNTQEVQWKGELIQGKTVVPVTVRGVRPGRWEILAVVRKDQLASETRIIVPVQADRAGALAGGDG